MWRLASIGVMAAGRAFLTAAAWYIRVYGIQWSARPRRNMQCKRQQKRICALACCMFCFQNDQKVEFATKYNGWFIFYKSIIGGNVLVDQWRRRKIENLLNGEAALRWSLLYIRVESPNRENEQIGRFKYLLLYDRCTFTYSCCPKITIAAVAMTLMF